MYPFHKLWIIAAGVALSAPLWSEPVAQPFAMPVKESAFDIATRELFAMSENALDGHHYHGALSYLCELRTKLAKDKGTADYALVSAMLAEACFGFQPQITVSLTPAAGGGSIVPAKLAQEALAAPRPAELAPATRAYIDLMQVRLCQFLQDWRGASQKARALWQGKAGETPQQRLERLGDLHNWTLLALMQSLTALADMEADEARAVDIWRQVLELSKARAATLPAPQRAVDAAAAAIEVRRGEMLRRTPRRDVQEVEFIRLKGHAFIAVGDDVAAERELRHEAMSLYAEERAYLLLSSLARQGKEEEAEKQYERCCREYPLRQDASPLLRLAWRKALWTLLELRYAEEQEDGSEELLGELEPLLRPAERVRWLMLRLQVIAGQLRQLEPQGAASASRLEHIHSACLKYSTFFPGICLPQWRQAVGEFTPAQRQEYYQLLSQVTSRLAQAQAAAGNINTACELLEQIGASAEVPDRQRYEAYVALGDIAANDIKRSIAAYQKCEELKGVSLDQKAEALYRAAQLALEMSRRGSATKEVRAEMIVTAERLLRRLCAEYKGTAVAHEAAFTVGELFYQQHRYQEAMPFYEEFFGTESTNLARRDQARLRLSRCRRLHAESLADAKTAEAQLRKALSLLSLLEKDGVSVEVTSQASLESYRVCMTLGENERAERQLDALLETVVNKKYYGEVLWVALYERMLNRYQRHQLKEAADDGRLYEELRIQSRLEVIPWERETLLLLGDIEAARAQWRRAASLYARVEHLPPSAGGNAAAPDEQALYAACEGALCLAKAGESAVAYAQLKAQQEAAGSSLPRFYAYQIAMRLGDLKVQMNAFSEALAHFEQAQLVYGQDDTYKTHVARCRQGEMLLFAAEKTLQGKPTAAQRTAAIRQLEQAAVIFAALFDVRKEDGGQRSGQRTSAAMQDHSFDLYLRAQYGLGYVLELAAEDAGADVNLREQALACYRRICDYFIVRARQGQSLGSSRYYVKSLDRRIRLLTGSEKAPSRDVLDLVARLYDEYAELNLEGSLLARRRAEKIRQRRR